MIEQLQLEVLKGLPGFDAQKNMMPSFRGDLPQMGKNPRIGGVLIVLYQLQNEWSLILIERAADGNTHSAQIAFPGGKYDADDWNTTYTALRECQEEISLNINHVQILGNLSSLYIPPSNFLVHPVLAYVEDMPELFPEENEVARIISVSLKDLFHSKTEAVVRTSHDPNLKRSVPAYKIEEDVIVWGATAMILAELEHFYRLL